VRSPRTRLLLAVATFAAMIAGAATAQIGLPGPIGGLPSSPTSSLPSSLRDLPGVRTADDLARGAAGAVLDDVATAPRRLQSLIRGSRGALQADALGWPVVAGELVVMDLSDAARAQALAAGFTLLREERLEGLDLTVVVLSPPRRLSLERAAARLRALAPDAGVTLNHVLTPAGAPVSMAASPVMPGPAAQTGPGIQTGHATAARLGLIDTGIEATHPALAGSEIEQRGFAGPARMGDHGTAVASLMAGSHGVFRGGAPGASLRVADIYGGHPAGGSSTALAAALSWMVETRTAVVNVSLVGPRNPLVERAVAAAQSRGLVLVAAVGNDGPAAPPLYPAAYPGVIGVTAVNARDQALPEAARGDQVDFAAPGADMAAAGRAGSFVSVRGASFASPLVAGLIARDGLSALTASARDLGARGRDPVYGSGLVGAGLRTPPAAVGARGRLSR
jgi:hypothetical protein